PVRVVIGKYAVFPAVPISALRLEFSILIIALVRAGHQIKAPGFLRGHFPVRVIGGTGTRELAAVVGFTDTGRFCAVVVVRPGTMRFLVAEFLFGEYPAF